MGEVVDYFSEDASSEPANSSDVMGNSSRSGLKEVQVPLFKGNREDWPYFWVIFKSLVHGNKTLSEPVKLAHLNNSLADNVKILISCLTGGPGDYEKAVKLLEGTFGDPRNVIEAHLNRITDWPAVRSDDRTGFEGFADALQAAVFALDNPTFQHELKSLPLCTQLVRKLPAEERDEWVRQVERGQVQEDLKGLAEWAQTRSKTLRMRERYNEQPTAKSVPAAKGASQQRRHQR
ncbi:uncharacterized protein LOC125558915 [Nematostella vectensis]|uniref:uncharacterized protein LOC125558915 n=1 Tax=Nematostella vectensis TaxID=45351 RepID=UPI0020770098|nr:uncharacterized protein LOC125558915 [Nematostella vectensis]